MNLSTKTILFLAGKFSLTKNPYKTNIYKQRRRNIHIANFGKMLFDKKIEIKKVYDSFIEDIKIRVYSNSDTKNQKVIIYFHGGGFVYYTIDSHDYVTRRLCYMNDCTVISVDYKLAPEYTFPAAHKDSYKVVEYIYEHAIQFNIDQTKIIVAGDSAGGNLAACCAFHFRYHPKIKIAAQLLIYPWVDGTLSSNSMEQYKEGYLLSKESVAWFQKTYTPNPVDYCNPEVAPTHYINFENLPPAFILTAEFDPLKDEGFEYAEKLKRANNIVLYKDYKQLIHGFFNIPFIDDEALQAYYDIQAFLDCTVPK